MFSEFGFFHNGKIGTKDDSHPNFVEHVNSSTFLCCILQALNQLCIYVCILHGTIVFDIFFINPNTKPLFIFLPFPHGHIVLTRIQAWGPTPPIPSSQDAQAEALHRRSSCRVGRTTRCESSVHAHLHVQPGEPPAAAGKAG